MKSNLCKCSSLPARLRTACGARLLSVLPLLALPAVVQAQFLFTTNNGTITITGYTGPGGAVTIPGTTNGRPVTRIGNNAFQNNTSLTSVTIPNSVTNIGFAASLPAPAGFFAAHDFGQHALTVQSPVICCFYLEPV